MSSGGLVSKIMNLFQKTRLYHWLIRKVLPFLSFRIWGVPSYPMENYFKIRKHMLANQEKMFAFAAVNKLAASYVINKALTGAKWSHAGLCYLDANNEVRIYHMMNNGFCDWNILDYLKEVDNFALLLLPIKPELSVIAWNRVSRLKERCSQIGYDFDFELSESLVKLLDKNLLFNKISLYCSELVWITALGLVEDSESLKPHWKFDRKTFEPDDVWEACTKITLG